MLLRTSLSISRQLRRSLLRYISSSKTSHSPDQVRTQSLLLQQTSFSASLPHRYLRNPLSPPFLTLFRLYSEIAHDSDQIAHSLSTHLTSHSEPDALSLPKTLDLNFSHINLTNDLILHTLNLSPEAGRTVLGFFDWVSSRPSFEHTDETVSYFVDYFGRRKDFKAIHDVLVKAKGVSGTQTLELSIHRLVRAGRAVKVVSFFDRMEQDYGLVRNIDSLRLVISRLCEHGFASYAEKMVKSLANVFFPDEMICNMLIKGWCIDGKLDEAKRLAGEMYRGGFEIGTMAYNSILDCVCKLCRKKDPFRLQSEAEKVLLDMECAGVPRNVETFNVIINNFCKIRKTEDALKLFYRMGEWGCYPDSTTFLVLIRSLYQAARVAEGDEMIDRMKSAGYGVALDKKAYYGFLKILCGIERIDHALSVFGKMKKDGCQPGVKTYDLLLEGLCAHGRTDKANALFKEAENTGLELMVKVYKVDPRFVKKTKVEKKEKSKRETLPEKMARKRRRLKKIRLSYVKKPQKMMFRGY